MSDTNNDLNHPVLNLSPEEKRVFSYLFSQADSDQLGVVTGERAVSFFERTKVSPNVLGEIWQIADTENRGLLTKPGFCMVLRLIGHYQAGKEPTAELAFRPGPIPKFEGLQIPGVGAGPGGAVPSPTGGQFPANALQPQLSGQGPIRVPPLDPQKVQQYSGLFERSGAQNGLLDGATAKSIFERAGLPNEALGKIWNLSDREQRGALDQTEFIVAMHLLTSMKTRTMAALPNTLPPGFYEAAARRGAPPPPGSRQGTGPAAIPRQFTGGSAGAPPRTQSPLARPPGYATPPPQSVQTTGTPWLVTSQDKAKFDQFFATIDTQGRGVISGEQAVRFFSDSRLPEDTLASIWDLADINSEGQLNRDEFAVAMYLIRQQRAPNPPAMPAFLPPALVPPAMRQQTQQSQSTAPTFDNANNTSNLPKSATEDLFGLDEPSPPPTQQPQQTGFQPQPPAALQAQGTGASATRDPFGGSVPGSPSSPQRFQPQTQQANTMFKPFMPTSAFGTSLTQQHTGGSSTSSQGQPRGFQSQQQHQPSHLQQASATDDLLGDNDTHAEESSKLTNETTELANMSNQIGNLRTQMEQTQSKKSATQADLNATNTQKRDLEMRLQQFRAQYEQEVRAVKELEQQLVASRESTKKLGQELAMLEGTHQDLQSQHNTVAGALQADQQENANLKQKISQTNAEVARLKPEIEKMKLDARQQKGMVSINKKQLATNEGERDRLQGEKSDLEREATEREEQARNAAQQQHHYGRDAAIAGGIGAAGFGAYEAAKHAGGESAATSPGPASNLASPSAASTLSSTNPFFRKASAENTAERATSPPVSGPTPSAFDALFGPSAAFSPTGQASSRTGTPPPTSFVGRSIPTSSSQGVDAGPSTQPSAPQTTGMTDSIQSVSSVGEPTPSATPPLSDRAKESPQTAEPPPPPENRQFTPSQLPVIGLTERHHEDSEADSTRALPPASRAGGTETPKELAEPSAPSMPGSFNAQPEQDDIPGAFPADSDQPTTTSAQAFPEESSNKIPVTSPTPKDDFDSAFAGFGEGEKASSAPKDAEDPFAPSSSQPQGKGFSGEFPPIQNLESEDDSSDDESDRGFGDDFTAAPPQRNGTSVAMHGTAEHTPAPASSGLEPQANIAGARPQVQSVPSTASDLPPVTSQTSPPTYEQSDQLSHGGSGERTGSNNFPREFGGLLPSREDPTSPPPPSGEPPQQSVSQERQTPRPQTLQSQGTGSSLFPSIQTPSSSDVFHDASSRPMSSVTDATPPHIRAIQGPSSGAPRNAFDDFDDFGDLSQAQEADKSGNDFDFNFGGEGADDFGAAFDSPATSMATTVGSSQRTPVQSTRQPESNGFENFQPSATTGSGFGGTSGSVQHTPQNAQHDWDAIFSGLDTSKDVDTSFGPGNDDPWGASSSETQPTATNGSAAEKTPTASPPASTTTAKAQMAPLGRALTPGTEHDDPILKRLTGMGYARSDALNALEMYDYDINKAVDHLTSN